MKWCTAVGAGLLFLLRLPAEPMADVCVLVGAPGQPEFAAGFTNAAKAWQEASARSGAACQLIGLESDKDVSDRDAFQQWLTAHQSESNAAAWIVYIGHGTFDGREARLSLRGPDVSAKELATWLEPLHRPVVFVHGGSASAPFIPALSAAHRIIITATRSGHELNYARFGERFAQAVASPSADIDQDGQTSVLEAFVTAAQHVQAFYSENGRLATEHALIDDNGDRQGTPAEWFRGTRLQRRPPGGTEADGARANQVALVPTADERLLTAEQRAQRETLERDMETLRAGKAKLPENEYYRRLEVIAQKLGTLYRETKPTDKKARQESK